MPITHRNKTAALRLASPDSRLTAVESSNSGGYSDADEPARVGDLHDVLDAVFLASRALGFAVLAGQTRAFMYRVLGG